MTLPVKFKPVPLRSRHDGWTAEKQIAFIEALAETACAEEACRRVRAPSSAASNFTRNDAAPRELSEVKPEQPSGSGASVEEIAKAGQRVSEVEPD